MQGNIENPRYNAEGYPDPTAYKAMNNIMLEELEEQRKISEFIHIIKFIADKCGYTIQNRIVLKDKKTGKEYK